MFVGPPRSGKGTIGHVLEALVGRENFTAPSISDLSTQFGVAELIGKSLAIIADARIGGRTDLAALVERLLSISGGDSQSIPRKHISNWNGLLPTRFAMLTNELPKFTDASGALPSRLIILILTISFLGREDGELLGRILGELPSIFRWALDGLDRLRKRKRFVIPRSSKEAVRQVEDLASPVGAFIRERCVIDARDKKHRVQCTELHSAYKQWSVAKGFTFSKTEELFGRDLSAACPGLKRSRLWVEVTAADGKKKRERKWHYIGIALRRDDPPPPTPPKGKF